MINKVSIALGVLTWLLVGTAMVINIAQHNLIMYLVNVATVLLAVRTAFR